MNERKPHRTDRNVLEELRPLTNQPMSRLQEELLEYLATKFPDESRDWDRELFTVGRWLRSDQSFPFYLGEAIQAWAAQHGVKILLVPHNRKKRTSKNIKGRVKAPLERLLNANASLNPLKSRGAHSSNSLKKADLQVSLYPGSYREIFTDQNGYEKYAAWIEPAAASLSLNVSSTTKVSQHSVSRIVGDMGKGTLPKGVKNRSVYRWNVDFSTENREVYRGFKLARLEGSIGKSDILEVCMSGEDVRIPRIEILDESEKANPDKLAQLRNEARARVLKKALRRQFEHVSFDVFVAIHLILEDSND